ncbi:type IV secretory system conjugative DNA transfer family protein [Streptomyces sp. NPDC058653]|uniref:type IV secretory system conjugative DNA transfer family protein n=1 Tax=Streptomyces sp. NPDC058653 TaxID=3346576 RepID=UPI00365E3235
MEIECGTPRADRGTGFLIAPGLVLTAAHVVGSGKFAASDVRLRRATRQAEKDWKRPEALVFGAPGIDVALLRLAPEDHDAADLTPTLLRIDVELPLAFRAPGFPRVQREGDERDVEVARGATAPGTAGRRGALSLDVASAVPVADPRRVAASPWGGMSGAPVFLAGRFLGGVVVEDNRGFGGSRLEAVAVAELLDDSALGQALPRSWWSSNTRRAGSLVALSVGAAAIRVDPPYAALGSDEVASLRASATLPLRSRYRVVPFTGRDEPLEQLTRWCLAGTVAGTPTVAYALVSGAGGSGKSRLAAEVCQAALDAGFVAGTVTALAGSTGADIAELGLPVVLTMDYVDHQAEWVGSVIDHCRSRNVAVRLVVLARDGAAFQAALADRLELGMLEPALTVTLDDASLDGESRRTHHRIATEAFRSLLGPQSHSGESDDSGESAVVDATTDAMHATDGAGITDGPDSPETTATPTSTTVTAAPDDARNRPGIEETGSPAPDGKLDRFTTPLLVHAAALLDVLAERTARTEGTESTQRTSKAENAAPGGPSVTTVDSLLGAVLAREERYFWRPVTAELGLPRGVLRDLLAVATFAGADSPEQADAVIAAVPALADATAGRRAAILERLAGLYHRGDRVPVVQPDLLGEYLIGELLLRPGRTRGLFTRITAAAQRSRMLEVLLRMRASPLSGAARSVGSALRTLLEASLGELVAQADEGATAASGSDEQALAGRLTAVLEAVPLPANSARVAEEMPSLSRASSVQPMAAVLYRQAAAHWTEQGEPARAAALFNSAGRALVQVNRPEAAFDVLRKATSFVSAPGLHSDPLLSRILTTRALAGVEAGNADRALLAARDAVAVSRQAVTQDPEAHRPAYVEALSTLTLLQWDRTAVSGAADSAAELVVQAAELGPLDHAQALITRSQVYLTAGDVSGAAETLTSAAHVLEERTESEALRNLAIVRGLQSQLSAATGDEARARELAGEAVALVAHPAEAASESARLTRIAALLLALVAFPPDEALALAEDAYRESARLREEFPDVYGMLPTLASLPLLEMTAVAGDEDRTARIAARVTRDSGALFGTRPRLYAGFRSVVALTVASALNTVGQGPEAVDALRVALRDLGPIRTPGGEALTARLRIALAGLLLDLDDNAEAASLAGEAADFYTRVPSGDPADLVGARLLVMVGAARAGQTDVAGRADEEAVRAARANSRAQEGDSGRRLLALTLAVRGEWLRELGRLPGAADAFHEAAALCRTLPTPGDEADLATLTRFEAECLAELGGAPPPVVGDDSLSSLSVDGTERWRVVLGRFGGRPKAAPHIKAGRGHGPPTSRKNNRRGKPTPQMGDGPALVTSVRADVLAGSADRRRTCGEISVFEPTGRLSLGGHPTTTWNPLEDCVTWDGAVITARSLTEAARLGNNSGLRDDAFWYSMAEQLLQSLLFAAATTGQTMDKVNQWVKSMNAAEVFARLRGGSPEALATFHGTRQLSELTLTSVYATASTLLRAYDSSEVRARSVSGFQIDRFLGSRADTLYLCAPPEEQEMLAPIFTALIRRVVNAAYRRHEAGERTRLLLLLDEAGNIAKIDNLDTIATTAAGTEIQLVTVFHDVAQMEALYGEHRAQSLVNNHSALLVLPGNRDIRTGHVVREMLVDEPVDELRRRPVRRLHPGTALCVYENLRAEVISLRSSTHDRDLIDFASPPGE